MAEKTGRAQEKGREKARKKIEKKKPHGKQTIKQLNAQGVQLSNIKITDENIKSFDRVARKYGIDYSLKKKSVRIHQNIWSSLRLKMWM